MKNDQDKKNQQMFPINEAHFVHFSSPHSFCIEVANEKKKI